MRLNPRTQLCQGSYLLIGKACLLAAIASFDPLCVTTCCCLDDNTLVAKMALDDFASSGIDNEVIGVDRARNDGLTQAGACVDHSLPALASEWVSSEENTSDRSIGHALDNDGKKHIALVNAITGPVAHSALSPQRSPAATYCVQYRIASDNIEVGILLTSKGSPWQVFSGSRGAHGYGNSFPVPQGLIRLGDCPGDSSWNNGF